MLMVDKPVSLPIERICVSAVQPRTRFDAQALDSLSESIRAHGLLSPIVVRRSGDQYELIAGERRLRAVRQLGLTVIPAFVKAVDEREAALMTLIENMQREQLHYLEEAQAYRRMLDQYGFSQEALASRLSISQSALANKLRLLKLSPEIRARLMETALTERHARALLRLHSDIHRMEALRRAADERMSVRQLEDMVERMSTIAPPRSNYRLYLRDHRMLINTVLGAVKSINAAGIAASSRVEHREDRIDVIVSLPL